MDDYITEERERKARIQERCADCYRRYKEGDKTADSTCKSYQDLVKYEVIEKDEICPNLVTIVKSDVPAVKRGDLSSITYMSAIKAIGERGLEDIPKDLFKEDEE